jgi:hypothetical protein
MGFIPPLIATIGSVVGGAAASAGGALAGATGISGFGAAGAAANSLIAGGAASLGTTAGLTSAVSLAGAIPATISALKGPKIPPPPATPALSSMLSKQSLVGPYEGSANGTLVSGTNQRSAGGSKTLLGQ